MKPFQAILRKESRQQGALALCMVLFCFFLQLGTVMMQMFTPNMSPDYLAIGLFVTALFAGAAAAISFSAEKDDRTFAFLRSLPVSSGTIMLGKTAWILLGTAAVLAGTTVLSLLWYSVTTWSVTSWGGLGVGAAFSLFGVAILEALVWGMFWSPRCRSQIAALLATYFCASICSYAAACFCAESSGAVVAAYVNAVPLRLAVVVVVAVFAVRGMLRWFDFSTQKAGQKTAREGSRFRLPFPRRLQSPFFSLLHQSIRQSQTLLLVGLGTLLGQIVCCCYLYETYSRNHNWTSDAFELIMPGILFALFYLIFCGSIFGMDQRNDSYRFLSRCGISPGKVWWSRIVTFFLLAAPMIVTATVLIIVSSGGIYHWELGPLDALKPYRPMLSFIVVTLLIPFSVGSFMSISLRSPIVAVTLTGVGSIVVYFWMLLGVNLFDFNPIWSTLPICTAFLAASRIRCGDWLRERRTWRSRWKSFAPVAVTFAVICLAIPPIRVYSVPFISMDELEKQFVWNSVRKDRDGSTPELRKVKFDEMRARLSTPLDRNERDLLSSYTSFLYASSYYRVMREISMDPSEERRREQHLELLKSQCRLMETLMKETPTYDHWILKLYELDYRISSQNILPFLPWEKARYRRVLNENLAWILNFDETKKDPSSWHGYDYSKWRQRLYNERAVFNRIGWNWYHASPMEFIWRTRSNRMELVRFALHAWYVEHDKTLPKSLDELAEAGYLEQIPMDPESEQRMEFFPDPNLETAKRYNVASKMLVHGNDKEIEFAMPFIKLNDSAVPLQFMSPEVSSKAIKNEKEKE